MQIKRQRGFTLVEIIIGIVVFSISLTIVANFLVPTAIQSANQIQSIRASELAQSLMNEILAKSFDEQSDRVGGITRCTLNCTAPVNLGADLVNFNREERANYNDVDDYDGLGTIDNIYEGLDASLYQGFSLAVEVFYDGNFDGIDDGAISGAKLIKISVTPPAGDTLVFAGYKVNF